MTLHNPNGVDPDDSDDETHPEKPKRIMRIHKALSAARLLQRMEQIPMRPVRRNEVMLIHTKDLVDKVEALQSKLSVLACRDSLLTSETCRHDG
jgi:acetoin utilization deacetylase AcuC-like enzyme